MVFPGNGAIIKFTLTYNNESFRFNLMAVVPDRRLAITHKLKSLESNKGVLQSALRQLCKIKQKMDKLKAKREADITNNTIIHLGRHHQTKGLFTKMGFYLCIHCFLFTMTFVTPIELFIILFPDIQSNSESEVQPVAVYQVPAVENPPSMELNNTDPPSMECVTLTPVDFITSMTVQLCANDVSLEEGNKHYLCVLFYVCILYAKRHCAYCLISFFCFRLYQQPENVTDRRRHKVLHYSTGR